MNIKFFDKLKAIVKELQSALKSQNTKNLPKKFLKKEHPKSDFIARKTQSMKDSQGKSDFSGSGYNGPGNVDREKVNSNMSQRNFER